MDEHPIGSVANLVMGQSPRGEDCNARADGVPLLNGPTEFGSHHPTPRQWTTDAKRTCRRGAVLLCVRGSTTGRTNRADQTYALGRGVAAIQVDSETDQTYVFYALLARLNMLLERTTGSVFPNLSRDDIASLQIPWPAEPVRSGIAEVLGSIDDLREANEEVVAASTRLMATTFASLFAPALDAVAGRAPVPAGWCLEVLGDWLSVLETGTRPKGGVSGILNGVPSVGAESIVDLGLYDYEKTRFVPDDFYSGMRRGHVEDRDVLLYKDGGRPGEFEPHVSMFGDDFPFETFCINEHVYRLRAREPLTQEFLFSWLSAPSLLEEMRRRGTGVAIPGLNSTSVKLLPLIVPPRALIDEFTTSANELTRAVFAAGRENRTLSLLRSTLLRALFSDEIRVSERQMAGAT